MAYMTSFKHGLGGYTHQRCRCSVCVRAKRTYQREYVFSPAAKATYVAYQARYKHDPANRKVLTACWTSANHKAYRARYRTTQASIAHRAVHYAVRVGNLIRPYRCSLCNKPTAKLQAHHKNYRKPLDVAWLCPPCHRALHLRVAQQRKTRKVKLQKTKRWKP